MTEEEVKKGIESALKDWDDKVITTIPELKDAMMKAMRVIENNYDLIKKIHVDEGSLLYSISMIGLKKAGIIKDYDVNISEAGNEKNPRMLNLSYAPVLWEK